MRKDRINILLKECLLEKAEEYVNEIQTSRIKSGKEELSAKQMRQVKEKYINARKNDLKQFQLFVIEMRPDLMRTTKEKIVNSLKEYSEYRYTKGCADATVKKNVSVISHIVGVPSEKKAETIGFVIKVGQPTKGRDNANRIVNELNFPVIELNNRLGIRKEEILDLKGADLIERGGNLYVRVRRGKGGKYQEQLVLKINEEYVRNCFAGHGPNEYIFSKEARKACAHANLHACRRELAQQCYAYYEELLKDPDEREKIKDLLEQKFKENPNKKNKFNRAKMDSPYVARGKVKLELYEAGRPLTYDRLALLATSVLHLAHYREDVTVKNYMK